MLLWLRSLNLVWPNALGGRMVQQGREGPCTLCDVRHCLWVLNLQVFRRCLLWAREATVLVACPGFGPLGVFLALQHTRTPSSFASKLWEKGAVIQSSQWHLQAKEKTFSASFTTRTMVWVPKKTWATWSVGNGLLCQALHLAEPAAASLIQEAAWSTSAALILSLAPVLSFHLFTGVISDDCTLWQNCSLPPAPPAWWGESFGSEHWLRKFNTSGFCLQRLTWAQAGYNRMDVCPNLSEEPGEPYMRLRTFSCSQTQNGCFFPPYSRGSVGFTHAERPRKIVSFSVVLPLWRKTVILFWANATLP